MPNNPNCCRADGDCSACDVYDVSSGQCGQDDNNGTGVFDGFGYTSDTDPEL